MAASSARIMLGSLPPLLPPTISTPSNNVLAFPTHQVINGEGQNQSSLKSFSIPRRDMICLTAQTLTAATFWSAQPAEARVSRSEIKKKLLEKLKQLREKVGFVKPEDYEDKNSTTPEPPSAKDGDFQSSTPSTNLEENPVRTLADAVFP